MNRIDNEEMNPALAGVTQWTERGSANPKVAGSIPTLGHTPVFWARSPVGGMQEATTH